MRQHAQSAARSSAKEKTFKSGERGGRERNELGREKKKNVDGRGEPPESHQD